MWQSFTLALTQQHDVQCRVYMWNSSRENTTFLTGKKINDKTQQQRQDYHKIYSSAQRARQWKNREFFYSFIMQGADYLFLPLPTSHNVLNPNVDDSLSSPSQLSHFSVEFHSRSHRRWQWSEGMKLLHNAAASLLTHRHTARLIFKLCSNKAEQRMG